MLAWNPLRIGECQRSRFNWNHQASVQDFTRGIAQIERKLYVLRFPLRAERCGSQEKSRNGK